jgi:hypothetical protein
MSAKGPLLVVGLAGVGLYLATRKNSQIVEVPAIQHPELDEPQEPPDSPAEPGQPPAGSGEPEVIPEEIELPIPPEPPQRPVDPWTAEKIDSLPSYLQDINLSGNEKYEYTGQETVYDKLCLLDNMPCRNRLFDTWLVHDSLNGLTIKIFVQVNMPANWLSVFIFPDRLTVYKLQGVTQRDRDWFAFNILKQPKGSYLQDALF